MKTEISYLESPVSKQEYDSFPPAVQRSYKRAILVSQRFRNLMLKSHIILPEESCICLNGSTSRNESVPDSDIDYVLVWDDLSRNIQSDEEYAKRKMAARVAVDKINSILASSYMRPCDSFSCEKPLSELISTENLFSRYSILTLIDSSFEAGSEESYRYFLSRIEKNLREYAIGISAEQQVIRTLVWYIQREGWINQLQVGTSVNRFSRLIQLFVTILSIHQFGIEETRKTKTTWLRIEQLSRRLDSSKVACLRKLWVKAIELKEDRATHPMLKDTGFIALSELMEIWKDIVSISQGF